MRRIGVRVLWVVVLLGAIYSYEPLNHASGNLHFLRTPLDQLLPVVPIFAVPYLSYLPFLAVTIVLFATRNWQQFKVFALALIIASLAADVVYIVFQTYVVRPEITGTDIGSSLVRYVYANDQPYNDFPSLHTAGSVLCGIAYFAWKRAYGWTVLPLVVAIVASTVLIRQHYLADVVGGLVLAFTAYFIAWKLLGRSSQRSAVTVAGSRAVTSADKARRS